MVRPETFPLPELLHIVGKKKPTRASRGTKTIITL